MRYFDYGSMAREANIPNEKLAELCALIRAEFPNDDLLYELHVLRACMAVRDRIATVDEILAQEPAT